VYVGKIENGSHAGWRKVFEAAKDWTCPECEAHNRYYWTSCPNCSHPRPE
jgi:rubredoxin